MPDTNLVEHVGIESRDICQSESGVVQVLEHLLADIAGEEVLVRSCGAQVALFRRRQRHILDRRLEDLLVDAIEVDLLNSDRLGSERHDDEAGARVVDRHSMSSRATAADSRILCAQIMVPEHVSQEVPAPTAAGRSSASYNRRTGGIQTDVCSRCGESSAFGEGLGSEHALDDEVGEAAAHLRQLIFNRKNGHRLARDRRRIQPAEHLEQLVDFLKNVLERQWPVRFWHGDSIHETVFWFNYSL